MTTVGFALKSNDGMYLSGLSREGIPLVAKRQMFAIRWSIENRRCAYDLGALIGMSVIRIVPKRSSDTSSKEAP